MGYRRSIARAHYEEMAAIFSALAVARRVASGEAPLEELAAALDHLDELRADHRQWLNDGAPPDPPRRKV